MAGLNTISPTRPYCTNLPSLPLSPDADDTPTGSLTRGSHVTHHDVDKGRRTHTTSPPCPVLHLPCGSKKKHSSDIYILFNEKERARK